MDWHLAEALIKSGADADAETIEALQKSIALNPTIARSHFLLGKVLMQRGRTGEAVQQLEEALRLDPENVAPVTSWRRHGARKATPRAPTSYSQR